MPVVARRRVYYVVELDAKLEKELQHVKKFYNKMFHSDNKIKPLWYILSKCTCSARRSRRIVSPSYFVHPRPVINHRKQNALLYGEVRPLCSIFAVVDINESLFLPPALKCMTRPRASKYEECRIIKQR